MLTRLLVSFALLCAPALGQQYPSWYELPLIVQTEGMRGIEPSEPYEFAPPRGSAPSRSLRVYRPTNLDAPAPVVVLVTAGMRDGHKAGAYDGWARLLASRGMAAVLYDTPLVSETHDVNEAMSLASEDLDRVLEALDARAAEWGLDTSRLAFWMCSANTRRGLKDAYRYAHRLSAVAVLYGVIEVAPETIAPDLPVMIVRAGQDMPHLNETIDRFAAAALERNTDLTLLNLPDAVHAFDVEQNTPACRAAIEHTTRFLSRKLVESSAD